MHYNIIKTAAMARTRLRLPMVWKADAVAAEELPEAVFWVFIAGERVRVEKTPGSDDEYIFPALQSGQYAWDLVVDAQVVLHGVLKVRGSAVPPGGGEVCGTLLVDAPAMVLVLSPGPRGEVGPQGVQGLSAYEVAVQHGYEGSEADWAEELSGAQAAATAAKDQATEAGKQATAAANSATAAAGSATTAVKQAEEAAVSAATASEGATAAQQEASRAKSEADRADTEADRAKSEADRADTEAARANTEADRANAAMTEIEYNLLPAAQAAKNYAEGAKTVAQKYAENAGSSATEAGEQAEAAAGSADTAGKQAEAAASSAEEAADSADSAANSATAAATAADAVKYDLLPMSVDWLHTQFVREIGDGNFAVTFNEEQQTLAVAFAHDIPEEQCENLLQLCSRVTPQNVGVVREAVPTDFTELEYLESSGTQYIDTGVVPQTDTRLYLDAEIVSVRSGMNSLFGVRNEVGTTRYYYDAYYSDEQSICLRAYHITTGASDAFPTGRFTAEYTGSEIRLNGKSVLTYKPQELTFDTANNLLLYAMNYNNNGSQQSVAKIYRFRLEKAKETLIDFVPVLDETGSPCMWDTVSHQKLPMSGTGRFGYRIKGTDVVVEPNATTYSLRAPRDPYYVAPSGVYARKVGENELEVLADTEETTGEGWEWFANTAEADLHFGIVPQEEFSTE